MDVFDVIRVIAGLSALIAGSLSLARTRALASWLRGLRGVGGRGALALAAFAAPVQVCAGLLFATAYATVVSGAVLLAFVVLLGASAFWPRRDGLAVPAKAWRIVGASTGAALVGIGMSSAGPVEPMDVVIGVVGVAMSTVVGTTHYLSVRHSLPGIGRGGR